MSESYSLARGGETDRDSSRSVCVAERRIHAAFAPRGDCNSAR